jgi:membrane protein implicated in regulation of membrane protease activity
MPEPSPPPRRFQVSIGWFLWTMFVCAVVAAVARLMNWRTEIQLPLFCLLIVYAVYAVFRLPQVLADLRGRSPKWQQIQKRRLELEQYAERRRSEATEGASDSPASKKE